MSPLEELPLPLLLWFHDNARDLPWRRDPSPYHVWVSEIMLQQTRVGAVMGYYARFLETLPTVEALACCPQDTLMKLWQGLGYYSRARNLQKAARQITEDLGGVFPREYGQLRKLAGVGDYTAGAIASIAFGQPVPAVDGNVLRVVSRLNDDHRDVLRPETREDIRRSLTQVLPVEMPGDFNQAMMDLGATVCLPNGVPLCQNCPCRGFCLGFRRDTARDLPVKTPKKARRVEERTVWLIFSGKRVALRRRPSRGLLAGLWEYPNDLGEPPCPVPGEARFAAAGRHLFTHVEWRMEGFVVEARSQELPEGWVWADRTELTEKYPVPSAFSPFTPIVLDRL